MCTPSSLHKTRYTYAHTYLFHSCLDGVPQKLATETVSLFLGIGLWKVKYLQDAILIIYNVGIKLQNACRTVTDNAIPANF